MTSTGENNNYDQWIEQLKQCHPLKESQIKTLCTKVRIKNKKKNVGKRNFQKGKQCPSSKSTSYSLW